MNRHQRRANSKLSRTLKGLPAESKLVSDVAELFQVGFKHYQAGRLAEAEGCYRRVLAIRPGDAEAHSNLGVALYDQGKIDQAVASHRQAIQINPDYAEAHLNLGVALKDQGKPDEAIAEYRQAIRIKPDYVVAYLNLGVALKDQGELEEAIAVYRQAIQIKPDNAETYSNLGVALTNQGKLDEGIAACRQAIAGSPNFAAAYNNIGLALTQLGRFPEARTALEQAIQLAPRNGMYLRNLGEIRRFEADDPYLATMEQLLKESASLSNNDRMELHFALGKSYDDLGRHSEAFQQWVEGNTLKRRHVAYNEANVLENLDSVRAVYTSEFIRASQNVGNPSQVPVFVIGMPRSGTTLVEQILASHPNVFAAGELNHFSKAIQEIQTMAASMTPQEADLATNNNDFYRKLGANYLAKIERLAPGATRIIDKMPRNFIFAGLIHLALPNAAIIHTFRDPVDTCLSCFSKLFVGEQNYTYDMAELGRYYRHYQTLMAHWHNVLPPRRILDVRYEDVVADLEGQARRIIGHCGLEWDAGCLAFHKTERQVRTASAAQVRQPIYKNAVGRWRVYEPFLGPLMAELGIVGDEN